jgi:hypothetical protein
MGFAFKSRKTFLLNNNYKKIGGKDEWASQKRETSHIPQGGGTATRQQNFSYSIFTIF